MSKKSVLGSDPFEWLKGNDKKENTENQKSDIGGQKKQAEKSADPVIAKKETEVKQEVKHEEKQEVEQEAKVYEPVNEPVNVPDTPEPQRSKVYEPAKVVKPYIPRREEKTSETSDILEVNRKAVLGKNLYAHHTKPSGTKQKDSPATAFIIVYTVLLLILGFIVYKDLTKQISTLETKLELVEKQLDAGSLNYEDTKSDGGW